MSKRRTSAPLLVSILLLGSTVSAHPAWSAPSGPEGRPGIQAPGSQAKPAGPDGTPISQLPFAIVEPGSYFVTQDLLGVSGNGISIMVGFVSLDLNGFSLYGGPGTDHGIYVPDSTRMVTIRNGGIRGWAGAGVYSLASESRYENLRVSENGLHGLDVGYASVVRNCEAKYNAGGISADSGSAISHSTAASNSLFGFRLLQGGTVRDVVASDNENGIWAEEDCVIADSTAVSNSDDGIRFGSRCVVERNLASGNASDGLHGTGSRNRIVDNHSVVNGTAGIRVDGTGSLVVKNSASGNLGAGDYVVAAGNAFGPIPLDAQTASPWANWELPVVP